VTSPERNPLHPVLVNLTITDSDAAEEALHEQLVPRGRSS